MRIRLPIRRTLFLAGALLFALLALLPLRLALDWLGFADRGLAARAVTGSVWRGALQEAQIGPVALGDVRARLNLLPLFLGTARLSLAAPDEGGLSGAILASRHGFGIEDVSGRIRPGALFAPLPLGSLEFDGFSAGFASGACTRAEGAVRATVTGQIGGAAMSPQLAGRARCAGDALLLPLSGRSGAERLDIRLFSDGRYRIDLLVRAADPNVAAALASAGFRASEQGHVLQVRGTF
jgi:general secretion pathway protein N